jgi:hypothetical protein
MMKSYTYGVHRLMDFMGIPVPCSYDFQRLPVKKEYLATGIARYTNNEYKGITNETITAMNATPGISRDRERCNCRKFSSASGSHRCPDFEI